MQLNSKYFNDAQIQEQLVKPVVSFGTGGIVYAPKKWVGRNVILSLPKELSIDEKIFNSLKPNLAHVLGIFLTGSFARGEQSEKSDIDALVVADKKFIPLKQQNLDITVIELNALKNSLKKTPIMFYPMLLEAKPIFNELLLHELRKTRINFSNFKWFFDSSEQSVKTIREFVDDEKSNGHKFFESRAAVYSLILRLKGLYLIKCIIAKKSFLFSEFRKFLLKSGISDGSFDNFLDVYKSERDEKKSKIKIRLAEAVTLLIFLANQINKTSALIKNVKKINQKRN